MRNYILLACCIFNLSMLAQWNSKKLSNDLGETDQALNFTPKQHHNSVIKVQALQNDPSPEIQANHSTGIVTVHIDNALPQTKICVYDATGKCVLEETALKKSKHDVDLSAQSKGIYVMEITSGEEKAVTKIMLE